jgi:hypothetical protein
MDNLEDPRRRLLIQALGAGLFASGWPSTNALAANFFGTRPTKLPPNQSIYRITGQASVNGKAASMDTRIEPGDTVETGKDSEIIFVVNGNHSMIMRADSHLVMESAKSSTGALLINGLRLLAGKLLSVSSHTPMKVRTATAVLGIRGTGFYVEADPALTYFCTCYGTTDITAIDDPQSNTTVKSKHHDRPLYIVKDAGQGKKILNAPFIDHTDEELSLIETLVGRTTPFIFENDSYGAPRREY